MMLDSDDERLLGSNQKMKELMKKADNGSSLERKEQLKMKLLNESQTYY